MSVEAMEYGTPMWQEPLSEWQTDLRDVVDQALVDLRDVDGMDGAVLRDVVVLRAFGAATYQEISDELGLGSRGNAYNYYHRGLRELARIMTIGDDSD